MTGWGPGLLLLGAAAIASPPPAPRRHVVEMRGMAFRPATLEVSRGDTVSWVNQDIVPHTATAKRAWDTGELARGERGQVVVQRRGELRYACTLHPTMTGTLRIR